MFMIKDVPYYRLYIFTVYIYKTIIYAIMTSFKQNNIQALYNYLNQPNTLINFYSDDDEYINKHILALQQPWLYVVEDGH